MKNIVIAGIILAIILLGGFFLLRFLPSIGSPLKNNSFLFPFQKTPAAVINRQTFKLSIAATDQEKQIGLSGKQNLSQDYGMLFPFEKDGYYAFWMKNMKFPIDIIYIRANKVTEVLENVQPPSSPDVNPQILRPKELADTVLEINAGLAKKYNIKKGDAVTIKK